jgi:hypothetical protein
MGCAPQKLPAIAGKCDEPGTGRVAEITDDLKRIFALGFTRMIVRYRGQGADQQKHQLDRFVNKIVPKA